MIDALCSFTQIWDCVCFVLFFFSLPTLYNVNLRCPHLPRFVFCIPNPYFVVLSGRLTEILGSGCLDGGNILQGGIRMGTPNTDFRLLSLLPSFPSWKHLSWHIITPMDMDGYGYGYSRVQMWLPLQWWIQIPPKSWAKRRHNLKLVNSELEEKKLVIQVCWPWFNFFLNMEGLYFVFLFVE